MVGNSPNLGLVKSNVHRTWLNSVHVFTIYSDINQGSNLRLKICKKMMRNNPNLDVVNIYGAQDIEQKRNFDTNQGP